MWPRTGWRRSARYVLHRLHRMPGTTGAIAAGFASGAAVSFTPLNGLHFILALSLAWLLRGSIIAAAVGTAVGNPWTFPPIWLITYWVGTFLLGEGGAPGAYALDFRGVLQSLWYGLRHLDVKHLADNVWPVWWPMMVGSLPVSIVAWFAFYVPLQRTMERYHHARAMRRLQKLAAGAKTMQAASGLSDQQRQP